MLDHLLFILFPYAVVILAIVMAVQRYFEKGFTYTSLSSQFLESGELFYGSVPWHYGILAVLTGHLIGFLCPAHVLWFNSVPVRLYILESVALLGGLLSLVGLMNLIVRRCVSARIRAVTSPMDVLVLVLLLVQVSLGVYTALFYRWGSSWYAASIVPYLRSLFKFQPDVKTLAPLPWAVKLHILNAYLLVAVFPFTRLVHMLVIPVAYLWRSPQVVIWNWNRRKLRVPLPRPQSEPLAMPLPERESRAAGQPAVTR